MNIQGLVKICIDDIVYDSFTAEVNGSQRYTNLPNGNKILTVISYIRDEK